LTAGSGQIAKAIMGKASVQYLTGLVN
jgi:hypothetical protein